MIAAALLLAASCGSAEHADDWAGTIRTRANGVTVVENPPEPLLPPEAPFPLELEATYGAAEEPEEAVLSARLQMALGSTGGVYVLDTDASRLVAFEPDGTVAWSASGDGEGPGELGGASTIVRGPDDEVWIARRQTTVIDRWSSDGRYVDSLALPVDELPPRPRLGSWIDDEVLLVYGGLEGALGARFLRVRWEDDALTGDGVFDVRLPEPSGKQLPPEGVTPRTLVLPGRLFTSGHFHYELREHRADGSLVRLVRRPDVPMLGPVFLPDVGGRAFIDAVRPPVELSSGHWLAGASWPTNIDDGEEFLRRALAGDPPDVEHAWTLDLFAPDGRLLATRGGASDEVPEEYPVAAGPSGRVYTFVADPFPQIRRYRLALPPS